MTDDTPETCPHCGAALDRVVDHDGGATVYVHEAEKDGNTVTQSRCELY